MTVLSSVSRRVCVVTPRCATPSIEARSLVYIHFGVAIKVRQGLVSARRAWRCLVITKQSYFAADICSTNIFIFFLVIEYTPYSYIYISLKTGFMLWFPPTD